MRRRLDGSFGEEKAGLGGWEMMEASETRRPSVKEMRERERSPDLARDQSPEKGEIKVPSFPAASSGLGPLPYSYLCVC